ncbi:hypothetical protein ECANGB1_2766 [Enterospora canceri]|uniref:Uncharacterized protein n=1 Tax=Enterospora canceri TaxID=1081671 RepID=A0A1Y1SAW6_9MICR|nr:hypothetical protein ECANGB1_2766 [Enterospora canceri]
MLPIFSSGKVDTETVFQSFIPLLISLLGLFASGSIYSNVIQDENLKKYPLVLLFTCVLGFKGNVEMIFSIHITHYKETMYSKTEYLARVFQHSNRLVFNSAAIGVTLGLIGVVHDMLLGTQNELVQLNILVTTAFSCVASSVLFVFSLLTTLEVATFFKMEVENVILPTLSAVSDLLVLFMLRFLISKCDSADYHALFLLGFTTFCLFCLTGTIAATGDSGDSIVPVGTLIASTASSVACGFIVGRLATAFPHVPVTFPFYSGMSISITLMFLHRTITADYSTVSKRSTETTLIFMALVFSLVFLWLSYTTLLFFSVGFSLLFLGGFVALVAGLIQFLNRITEKLSYEEIYTLPVITVAADVFSICILTVIGLCNCKCIVMDGDPE